MRTTRSSPHGGRDSLGRNMGPGSQTGSDIIIIIIIIIINLFFPSNTILRVWFLFLHNISLSVVVEKNGN